MSQLEFLPPSSPVPTGDTDHWFTPRGLVLTLDREFRFTLDAAGHPESPVTQAIGRWFGPPATPEVGMWRGPDALRASWAGERVWCNPPYSPGNLEAFVKKCEAERDAAEVIVALLPVRTDRKWWHKYIEPHRGDWEENVEVRFVEGRLSFGWPGNPLAKGGHSHMEPSCLVIWRGAAHGGRLTEWAAARAKKPAAKGVGFAAAAVKAPTR